MGMYSTFSYEEIEVKDMEGLRAFLQRWKNTKWYVMGELSAGLNMFDIIRIQPESKKERVTFENWSDIKLISYWYTNEVLFLHCVAKYLEGIVEWDFENKDETGMVKFEDGECIIHTGIMQYAQTSSREFINDREDKDEPQSVKEFLLLEDL